MKTLKGQTLRHKDYEDFEAQIADLIWDLVFKPIVKIIKDDSSPSVVGDLAELQNVGEKLLEKALKEGRVQMSTDPKTGKAIFTGALNRALSDAIRSFGGEFDKRINAYRCEMAKVPAWVRTTAEGYKIRAKTIHDKIVESLKDVSVKVGNLIDGKKLSAKKPVAAVDGGWREAAKGLEVVPVLSDDEKKILEDKLEESAKIPIKDWAQEAIDRLRDQVSDNAAHGYRIDRLASRIRSEYGTSQAKARFIARQETSNLMSDFRAARAKGVGAKRYQWDASMDQRTRKDHADLHGKIFFYDDPPIVDKATGRRANPGRDFNCRCVDLPILEEA